MVKFRTGEVWSWPSLAFWVNFFHAKRVLVSRWDAKDRDKTLIFEEKAMAASGPLPACETRILFFGCPC